MKDFDPHIHVENSIETIDSDLLTKEMVFENSIGKIETPFKVIDVSKFDGVSFEDYISDDYGILEKTKFINQGRNYKSLYSILETSNNNKSLNSFFKINSQWKNFNNTLSLVFSKNPFELNKFKSIETDPLSKESFEFLLDFIHSVSNTIILTPDISLKSFDHFNDYLQYLESTISILSSFNNKPIFAPVSMQLDNKQADILMDFYRRKGYSNFWFNFNSTQIKNKIPIIRFLLRRIDSYFGKDAVIYFSHIKKEITRNLTDVRTKPSDALSPFFGCDIIGANRESSFGGSNKKNMTPNEKQEFENKRILNKNRIFDPNSFFYFNVDKYPNSLSSNEKNLILSKNGFSDILNAKILGNEFNSLKTHVEENKKINNYLKAKEIFKIDNNLKNEVLTLSENQSTLSGFMVNF